MMSHCPCTRGECECNACYSRRLASNGYEGRSEHCEFCDGTGEIATTQAQDATGAVVDTRDEAVRLVERIAEKYVEPFSDGNDDKTIGCWRHELNALLYEAVEYENRRRARASANLRAITPDECGDMGRSDV